jgi:AhpD family alkylhydroperoxidase
MTLTPRINIQKYLGSPLARALFALTNETVKNVDHKLFELIKIRASQINGCAYCIDMHTKDARLAGETEQRIYALSAWRETPFFTDRERAALEWTEALTLLSETHAPDDVYERVREQFSEEEFVGLTFAVVNINIWNRIALPFRTVPGTYQPKAAAVAV